MFVVDLVIKFLGLQPRLASLSGFMLAADDMTDSDIALMAVAVYAMHRATAYYRRTPPSDSEQIRDFCRLCARVLCEDTECLRKCLILPLVCDMLLLTLAAAENARGRRAEQAGVRPKTIPGAHPLCLVLRTAPLPLM